MVFINNSETKGYRRRLFFWRAISFITVAIIVYLSLENQEKSSSNDYIANYNISGLLISADEIIEDLEELKSNNEVNSIIISVDSPGGTTVSAEEIYLKLKEVSLVKPTAIVMRNIATSGAYLLSLGGDVIFSRENTITGSIGVLLQWARVDEALSKLGIEVNEVKSGKLKAEPDFFGEIDEEAQQVTKEIIDETFEWFMRIVKVERNLNPSEIYTISDGRIFTGRQAIELNLVDEIGDKNDAKIWLVENKEIDLNSPIIDYGKSKKPSFIELSLANIMDYFNISTPYTGRIRSNLSLVNNGGLQSVWEQ
ncbi:MAG: signal peptide peptidase SppA [Alphaproteobacteria bacterium]|jgi:protease-4|nr:signal peptide peptidase SppA [Alphaproteobacteria bacterium]